jgi:DNA-binding response OmpR family regulator
MQTIFQPRASNRATKESIDVVTSHVLLVENDNQLAQLITQELNYEGYQTTSTKDGISGLLAARQTNSHLIIVSWSLSGISCIEFCRRLRSTHR